MAVPLDLIGKAERARASARALLERGDADGACNRAYYAMFDAARAVLLSRGATQDKLRTHSGVITRFGLQLVKPGTVDRSLGHALNRALEIRLIADYTDDVVDLALARWVVTESGTFVAAMRRLIGAPR